MLVKCPSCQKTVNVSRRAQGLGTTLDEKRALSGKEKEMLRILETMSKGHEKLNGEFLGFSVRAVETWISKNNVKRLPQPGSKTKPAPWDSHYIQSTLSLLVGRGLVEATQVGDRFVYKLDDGTSSRKMNLEAYLSR